VFQEGFFVSPVVFTLHSGIVGTTVDFNEDSEVSHTDLQVSFVA
jgi:hypothetical protein